MLGLRAYRRRLIFLFVALAAVALSSTAPASASVVKTIPGDNGTVKIHAVGTSFVDRRHVPHVCKFYLDAFGFDRVQQISWYIEQQPPTGHAVVDTGSLTLTHGKGTSAVMSLPRGHYKLVWKFTGEHGESKSKVFWSDCTTAASPSPSPSPSSSATMPSGGGTTMGPVTSSGKVVTPGGKVAGQSLAETGATLAPWLISGAALLLGGGWLTRRSRGRRMH